MTWVTDTNHPGGMACISPVACKTAEHKSGPVMIYPGSRRYLPTCAPIRPAAIINPTSCRVSGTDAPTIVVPAADPTVWPVSARKISGTAMMVPISRRVCKVINTRTSAPASSPICTDSISPPGMAE